MPDERICYQKMLILLQSVHLIHLLKRVGIHASHKDNAALAVLQFCKSGKTE